jgi:transposase
VTQELKRKGVTLTLLWQEYRTAHPDGYGYTWFCDKFAVHQRRANPTFRHSHAAGAVMQTDYAGPTLEVINPQTGEIRQAQIFVAVLGASSLTYAMASFGQRLPDWIEGQTRALSYFGGVPKAIVCDNLKAGSSRRCGSSRRSIKPLPPWPSTTTRRFCRPAAASRATRARLKARC